VKFNEPKPAEYPFGIVASFSDPDGNRFTLLQPHLPIREINRIRRGEGVRQDYRKHHL
jgi:hypothetical protein